jgi:hypothetical protein
MRYLDETKDLFGLVKDYLEVSLYTPYGSCHSGECWAGESYGYQSCKSSLVRLRGLLSCRETLLVLRDVMCSLR